MLFNTFSFALFLLITYTLYVLVFSKNLKVRNIFLLCASYFFYSCWNFKLLFVIIAVSAVDYLMGQKIQGTKSVPVTTNSNEEGSEPTEAAPYVPAKEAKKYLWIAILVNLGVLLQIHKLLPGKHLGLTRIIRNNKQRLLSSEHHSAYRHKFLLFPRTELRYRRI